MKKSLIALAILFLVSLAVLVYAAVLVEEVPVQTCFDSDNGLNYLVKGNVSGLIIINDSTTSYFLSDFCVSNFTVGEYACDLDKEPIMRQLWYENCLAVNKTSCSNGRCI